MDTSSPRSHSELSGGTGIPRPLAALVPGIFLAFVGFWMLTDGGPPPLGWACVALGQALLLTGAIAAGVAWGLDLHRAGSR